MKAGSGEAAALQGEHWENLQFRIIKCCQTIWDLASVILCDDSPEGLELDEEDEHSSDSKDILSYSWRAIHESSELTSTMAKCLNIRMPGGNPFISEQAFISIGELAFNQLANLRHRGAFSTVSATFSVCCKLSQVDVGTEKPFSHLLVSWYEVRLIGRTEN